jgi:class 3 adenylate cyclase/CHASE2 domain-containing sensor protein
VCFTVGLLDRLDNYGLDLHLQHLSTIQADPRIVLVDIDDQALSAVGDWPWPRRHYANIVGTLNELGARAIVLDLVLSEPMAPRVQHAGLGPNYDIDTELSEIGERSQDRAVYDDDELRDAIARAGNVYLAMFFRQTPPEINPEAIFEQARERVQHQRQAARRQSAKDADSGKQGATNGQSPPDDLGGHGPPYDLAFAVATLEGDFDLDAPGLTEKLAAHIPVNPQRVVELLPTAKRFAARRAARRFFERDPGGSFRAFFESVLPNASFQALSPDREDLLLAYRAEDAFRRLAGANPRVPDVLRRRIPHGYDLVLPLDKFAKAAKGIGFVSFEREKARGVVRDVPLIADASGVLVSQLGLLVVTDVLGIDRGSMDYEQNYLVLGRGPLRRRLPLDKQGLTLINWHVPRGSKRWQDSFDHIPVTQVLEITLNRAGIADNQKRLGLARAELVEFRHAETPQEYTEYVRLVNESLALQEKLATERDPGVRGSIESQAADIGAKIGGIEDEAVLWLRRVHSLWQGVEPVSEEERARRDKVQRLHAQFGTGQVLMEYIARQNHKLMARTETLLAELGPRMADKICLVGYTASGVADLVTSPVFSSMPGVMAHANIINMVLQDRPVVRAPRWLNAFVILLAGLAITAITCTRGPAFSLLSLAVLLAAVLGVGGLVFWADTYHLASLPAASAMCIVWAGVTVYRQSTEQRARRQFQKALAQYTSPAVAARIAVSATAADLAPRSAHVTCFFSDLYGFTPLSERLGPERTRLLLNPYLGTMSRVLVEHGAVINKFMGDGIFAFFNAPILPCGNHAEAACACALASLEGLRELNRSGHSVADGGPLAMRIGISTGQVFVGDYGSDAKLDYTCIGDTVNLGARLEAAGKAFGTGVLVDSATRAGAGARFAFRALGLIEVAGRTLSVEVHELLGLCDDISADTRDLIAHFEQAVRHYQAQEWDECMDCLDRCRELRPTDPAVLRYHNAAELYRKTPPPPDWNKGIGLAVP